MGVAVTLVLKEKAVNDAACAGTATIKEVTEMEVVLVAIAIIFAKIVFIGISPDILKAFD
jgi:hypothetical protein